jgi:hypothetical protein
MKKRMAVRWLPDAWERYQTLTPDQQEQARRLLAALLLSPEVGHFWHRDLAHNPLSIVSAYDTHVVYRVLYRTTGDTLFVLDVLVFPWEPPASSDNP